MTQDEVKIDIPERHKEFCKAVARLARDHGLYKFSGTFRPGYKDGWQGDISFGWESGRHEEDAGKISIQSQFYVHSHIDTVEKKS